MKEWRQFSMNLESLPPEGVEEIFRAHGAEAITYSDAGETPVLEPAPGETRLWPQARITGLFHRGADFERLQAALMHSFNLEELPRHDAEILPDRDWVREWQRDFGPKRFGRRLWVAPADAPVQAADPVVVRLEPGLAFGTGSHATTGLCLEWLDGLELAGKRVLDLGSGSGILSVAALLLGARDVTAVDIDPQARTATRRSAVRNGVANRLAIAGELGEVQGRFDVAVANLLAGPLVTLAEALCRRLRAGGRLALSGILVNQRGMIVEGYRQRVDFTPPVEREGWLLMTGIGRDECAAE